MQQFSVCGNVFSFILQTATIADKDIFELILSRPVPHSIINVFYIREDNDTETEEYIQFIQWFVNFTHRRAIRYDVHLITSPYTADNTYRNDFRELAIQGNPEVRPLGPWYVLHHNVACDVPAAAVETLAELNTILIEVYRDLSHITFQDDISSNIRYLSELLEHRPDHVTASAAALFVDRLNQYVLSNLTLAETLTIPNKFRVLSDFGKLRGYILTLWDKIAPVHSQLLEKIIV